jgi:hypothetical protein
MELVLDPYRVPFSLPVLAGKKNSVEKPPDSLRPGAALSAALIQWLFLVPSLKMATAKTIIIKREYAINLPM